MCRSNVFNYFYFYSSEIKPIAVTSTTSKTSVTHSENKISRVSSTKTTLLDCVLPSKLDGNCLTNQRNTSEDYSNKTEKQFHKSTNKNINTNDDISKNAKIRCQIHKHSSKSVSLKVC